MNRLVTSSARGIDGEAQTHPGADVALAERQVQRLTPQSTRWADADAAKRRRYLPDVMVAYKLHHDNVGRSYMEPIATYKMM